MMPAAVDRPACRSTGNSWAWRPAGRPGLHRSAAPSAQQTLATFSPTCMAQFAGPAGRAARRPRLAGQKDTACRFLTFQRLTNLKLTGRPERFGSKHMRYRLSCAAPACPYTTG